LQKIIDLFVVDLQKRTKNAGVSHRLKFIENLVDGSRNNASVAALEVCRLNYFLPIAIGAKHGKGLA
jgi:hypothetical protein